MKLEMKWGEETLNEKGQGHLPLISWEKKTLQQFVYVPSQY